MLTVEGDVVFYEGFTASENTFSDCGFYGVALDDDKFDGECSTRDGGEIKMKLKETSKFDRRNLKKKKDDLKMCQPGELVVGRARHRRNLHAESTAVKR